MLRLCFFKLSKKEWVLRCLRNDKGQDDGSRWEATWERGPWSPSWKRTPLKDRMPNKYLWRKWDIELERNKRQLPICPSMYPVNWKYIKEMKIKSKQEKITILEITADLWKWADNLTKDGIGHGSSHGKSRHNQDETGNQLFGSDSWRVAAPRLDIDRTTSFINLTYGENVS